MKRINYPLAMPRDLLAEMQRAARETGLTTAATIRQGAKLGLPKLLEQMGGGRVTNAPPLPAKVSRALYSQPDDGAGVTQVFMAAQSKTVLE